MKGRITINAKDTKKKQTYGNGSIYFVESRHRFAGQVYLTIDGEKERRTVYGKTKKIVKDKMRELQIQALAGNLEKRNRNKVEIKTIHQLAEKMIEEQLALNEIRQSTYDRKMETLKMLSDISDKQLTEVTEDDIVGFFKVKLDYSQSSINKMYQLLGAVFVKAISKKLIESNPLSDIKCPKSRKKQIPVRALTVDEQIRLLNVLKTEDIHYGDIMLLSMFTGMRIGDDDDKIRLNQRKPSKYKGLRRFGPEKNLQRINKFMKERPIFYKNLIQMKENIRFYLRCFYCITKVMILQFNSENRTELARNG